MNGQADPAPRPPEYPQPDDAPPMREMTRERALELLGEGASAEKRQALAFMFGTTGPTDERTDKLMFWRCTRTHIGPVLATDGRHQWSRSRTTMDPVQVIRQWNEGTIYPFETMAQLPVLRRPVYRKNRDGSIRYIPDPTTNDLSAPMIREPVYDVDPVTGAKTAQTEVVKDANGDPVVADFERVYVPVDRVSLWLAGAKNVGIENPVRAARIDGNYLTVVEVRDDRDMHHVMRDLAVGVA